MYQMVRYFLWYPKQHFYKWQFPKWQLSKWPGPRVETRTGWGLSAAARTGLGSSWLGNFTVGKFKIVPDEVALGKNPLGKYLTSLLLVLCHCELWQVFCVCKLHFRNVNWIWSVKRCKYQCINVTDKFWYTKT